MSVIYARRVKGFVASHGILQVFLALRLDFAGRVLGEGLSSGLVPEEEQTMGVPDADRFLVVQTETEEVL